MENENRVYLKYLVDKNVGPLTDVRIDFPFSSEGNPKPVILVGENGTGKSTILSNIVDAFFEMAGKIYSNACKSGENHSHLYFKAIFPAETHLGTSFMYSVISFFHPKNLNYIFKSGDLSFQDFRVQLGNNILLEPWDAVSNVKNVFGDEKAISDIWKNNVLCYFGPDRYEKPAWMVDNYYQKDEFLHPNMKKRWGDTLLNPIIAQGVTLANLQWILDVIADSRAEIVNENGNILLDCNNDIDDLRNLRKTRDNLESILSKIIGEDVYLQMNYRNRGGTRIIIVRKSDNCILCPTLDSLSTGQIALFNLFATIVRYADNEDLEKSFHLEDITGIVVIDEIELHLHSKLQKEVFLITIYKH